MFIRFDLPSHFSLSLNRYTAKDKAEHYVKIAQLWLKEKDELKAETYINKASPYVVSHECVVVPRRVLKHRVLIHESVHHIN